MIRDQSRFNCFAIESKRGGGGGGGGGGHEELKILLQICLIASRINQELGRKERLHRFLKGKFPRDFRTV